MGQHYFTRQPAAPHRPGTVHVVLPDLHLELETDSGMFSPARLDPGTRLLLDTAPPPPEAGDVLDLGSGYGPLALVLAARSPGATVWAVDVNERALGACARNARRAGLANVRCVTPDDPQIPAGFGLILSNPPARIGKPALHALLETWLARLLPGAVAYLVVQRHLGSDSLQGWLQESGWHAERAAARASYRVLRVRRGEPPAGEPPAARGPAAGDGR
jgi:16S rRNA (guanine1207-N2)-methyltransferase